MEELLALGLRQVPIVSRGGEWVNGQSLKDVARLIGVDLGDDVHRRLALWWEGAQVHTDWSAKADVYYGNNVSRHEFLERTTWHSGQHARQLMWLLQDKFAIEPDGPLGPVMWTGLPMPDQVWDS